MCGGGSGQPSSPGPRSTGSPSPGSNPFVKGNMFMQGPFVGTGGPYTGVGQRFGRPSSTPPSSATSTSTAQSTPALPDLAAPPPLQQTKDPLIGRKQNLGTAKIASPDLYGGTKTLLGG